MKKIVKILIGICIFSSTSIAQDGKLLLNLNPVDISTAPLYSALTEKKSGNIVLKRQYRYIDELDMNWVTYSSDGLKVTGLLIKPKEKGLYPCIIYNRGGNRNFGSLTVSAALDLAQLAIQGYVVIASNYRGGGGSEGNDEFGGSDVNDVLNLIEVLKEIEGANVDKIGMYGWSRGGMMTFLALTKTDKIDAVAVGGAGSDLTIIDRPEMEINVYAQLIPNYEVNKEEELKKRSAIFWVDKFPTNVPILMLHGNADWRVKPEYSLKLALEFNKYRIPYRLKIFEGGDHGLTEYRSEVNFEVLNWFDRFLKKDEKLPNMEYHGN